MIDRYLDQLKLPRYLFISCYKSFLSFLGEYKKAQIDQVDWKLSLTNYLYFEGRRSPFLSILPTFLQNLKSDKCSWNVVKRMFCAVDWTKYIFSSYLYKLVSVHIYIEINMALED